MLRRLVMLAGLGAGLWSMDVLAAQLTASWTDNSGGVATTRLERRLDVELDFTVLADVPPGVTTYADVAIVAGATYCYRAFAFDGDDQSPYTEEVCAASAPDTPMVTIAVVKAGSGTGAVVSSPAGIDCGATCAAAYPAGAVVTLVATPDSGTTFDGWTSGGCSGTVACSFAGNTATTITAGFTLSPVADTMPPTVALNVPATALTRKSLVTLTATASDDVGVTRVEFYLNNSLQCTDSAPPYTCDWRVPAASKSYVWQVKAYDAAGNVGLSARTTVTPR